MSSIKKKNEITLSQKSIAIKGFVHALQLVLVEAVPALHEVQFNSTSSESEGDEEEKDGVREKKISLSPGHTRDLHDAEETGVNCIIADDGEHEIDETELGWSDEEEDVKVDNIFKLMKEDCIFSSSMFSGGATKADVWRMIKEAEEREKNVKANGKGKHIKGKQNKVANGGQCSGAGDGFVFGEASCMQIVEFVTSKLSVEMTKLVDKVDEANDKIGDLRADGTLIQSYISNDIGRQLGKMKSDVINGITGFLDKELKIQGNKSATHVGSDGKNGRKSHSSADPKTAMANENQAPGLSEAAINVCGNNSEVGDNTMANNCHRNDNLVDGVGLKFNSNPSFSLGLTQEEVAKDVEGDGEIGCCKSKRQKTTPHTLVAGYHCDRLLVLRKLEEHLLALADGYEILNWMVYL